MIRVPYWLVVPAAGVGRRMGVSEPKQYLRLRGKRVIEHALAPFLADADCEGVVVALAAGDPVFPTLPVARDPRVRVTEGGAERRDSVLAGLERLATLVSGADPWVLVHDAARPCLSAQALERLKSALAEESVGALLAVPVADTLKRMDEVGRARETVPRDGLWRAQTPQAFRLQALRSALLSVTHATDEASAVEAQGLRPRLVAGSPANLKITDPADLALAASILAGEH